MKLLSLRLEIGADGERYADRALPGQIRATA
jgi:hypothetical protein